MKVKNVRGHAGKLLSSSVDAYVMSLETINRLGSGYRIEAFSYLICNAWELLMKAHLVRQTGGQSAVYYKRRRDHPKRSIALRDCVKKLFNNDDPINLNLLRMAGLRDESVHLIIAEVPRDVMFLMQACVLNYHTMLERWFGVTLSELVSVGMMTIVYDVTPERFDLNSSSLRKKLGIDELKYLTDLQQEIRREQAELGSPLEYTAVFDYKLSIVKSSAAAHILVEKSSTGQPATLVEVAKDPGKTHPLIQAEVVEELQRRLGSTAKITSFTIQSVARVHSIENRPDFFHQTGVKNAPKQYSMAFVDWIETKIRADANFLEETRQRDRTNRGLGSTTVMVVDCRPPIRTV